MNGSYLNLAAVHDDDSARFFEKGAEPASWFQTPGPDEDAAFDHYHPDAYDAVRLRTGTNSDDLRVPDRVADILRKFHLIVVNIYFPQTKNLPVGKGKALRAAPRYQLSKLNIRINAQHSSEPGGDHQAGARR